MPLDKYQSFLESRPGQRGGPIDGSEAAERRDRGCGLPSGVRGGRQGGMRHRGPETADEVQGVDSDADEVLVPDDEGDSARHVGKVWDEDAFRFQQLRDAGSSFHFPMGGMGSPIMIEQLSREFAQHCPHCPANERQPTA